MAGTESNHTVHMPAEMRKQAPISEGERKKDELEGKLLFLLEQPKGTRIDWAINQLEDFIASGGDPDEESLIFLPNIPFPSERYMGSKIKANYSPGELLRRFRTIRDARDMEHAYHMAQDLPDWMREPVLQECFPGFENRVKRFFLGFGKQEE